MGLRKYLKDEGLFGYNYWWLIQHPWIVPYEVYYKVKWFIQRGKRGYADCDAWGLAGYLNGWLPSAIRSLKGEYGIPVTILDELYPKQTEYTDEQCNEAHKYWHEILERMAIGFDSMRSLDEDLIRWDSPEYKQKEQDGKLALYLFKKYYYNLWD